MLLRQTLLYLPSQLAGPAMQFVFAIVWTHWLTDSEYGHLTLLIASQELIYLCCISWWSLFVLRYFGGAGRKDSQAVLGTEPGVLQSTCLPQVAMNIGVLAVLGELGNLPLAVSSTAYVVGRCFVTYVGERARTDSNITLYTIAQTGSLAAGGALGFLLVVYLRADAASVMLGFALSHLLVAFWLVPKLGIGQTPRRIDLDILKKAAVFGLPLVASGIINWINLNGIRVVVEAMGGATAVGLLAVGWGLGQRLSTTAAMFVTMAAFPLAARSLERGARAEALRQMQHGGTLLVGMVMPADAGVWMITPPFVHLLISEPFRDMTLAIMPLAVLTGAVRNIRVHYADMAIILFEKTPMTIFVNLFEAVFMICLCTYGYSQAGIWGAVAGACAASCLGAVFAFAMAIRYGMPVPVADWVRVVLATASMVVVLWEMPASIATLSDFSQIAIKAVAGAATYAVVLAALFPARLRDAARQALCKRAPMEDVTPVEAAGKS